MPKLGVFSGKEVCAILEKQGFNLVRQRGSHMIMQKRTANRTITVYAQLPNKDQTHVDSSLL